MKRLATIVVLGLMMGVALRVPAHAGGGGSAASSPTGHALAGKIQRLKLEAAKAEGEALAAKRHQVEIEITAAKVVGKVLAKLAEAMAQGRPLTLPADIVLDISLMKDLAVLASELSD